MKTSNSQKHISVGRVTGVEPACSFQREKEIYIQLIYDMAKGLPEHHTRYQNGNDTRLYWLPPTALPVV